MRYRVCATINSNSPHPAERSLLVNESNESPACPQPSHQTINDSTAEHTKENAHLLREGSAAQNDPDTPNLWRTVVHATMDAIVACDENGRIVLFNPAAERLFSQKASVIVGQPLEWILPSSVRARHGKILELLASEGRASGTSQVFRRLGLVQIEQGPENALTVEAHVSYRQTESGAVFTAVLRDITERLRAEKDYAALLTAQQRLLRERAAQEEAQRAFLRDVLFSVTEGRLCLCHSAADLPVAAKPFAFLRLQSTADFAGARQRTRDAGVAAGLPRDRWEDAASAASEGVMNALQHGSDEAICRWFINDETGLLQVWVEDAGTGIALSELPKATLLKGHSGAGSFGHGFYLMLHLVDKIYLLTGPQGTTVVLEQHRIPRTAGQGTHGYR